MSGVPGLTPKDTAKLAMAARERIAARAPDDPGNARDRKLLATLGEPEAAPKELKFAPPAPAAAPRVARRASGRRVTKAVCLRRGRPEPREYPFAAWVAAVSAWSFVLGLIVFH